MPDVDSFYQSSAWLSSSFQSSYYLEPTDLCEYFGFKRPPIPWKINLDDVELKSNYAAGLRAYCQIREFDYMIFIIWHKSDVYISWNYEFSGTLLITRRDIQFLWTIVMVPMNCGIVYSDRIVQNCRTSSCSLKSY